MKKIYVLAVFILLSLISNAQLTLEKTYFNNYGVSVVNIEDEGQKYMLRDTISKDLHLYNDDHSIWKRIPLRIPSGYTFAGVWWIAKKLIDLDDDLELSYSVYRVSGSVIYYTCYIIKEDGREIKIFDDFNGTYPYIVNGEWKLMAREYDSYYTEVYSCPGKYLSIKTPDATVGTESMIYPNPMAYNATIKYALPTGTRSGSIKVYDMQGKIVRSYEVTDQYNEILINRGELPAGIYNYTVSTTEKAISTANFIIE